MNKKSPFQWLWGEITLRFGEQAATDLRRGFYSCRNAELKERRARKSAEKQAQKAVPEGSKRCPHCNRVLPVDDFHRDKCKRDGRHSWCRDCVSLKKHGHLPGYKKGERKPYVSRPKAPPRPKKCDLPPKPPRQERSVQPKVPPRLKKRDPDLITVQEAESMSLEEWERLPLSAQERIITEYSE